MIILLYVYLAGFAAVETVNTVVYANCSDSQSHSPVSCKEVFKIGTVAAVGWPVVAGFAIKETLE